jgi:flavin-dependent dehydrogenase
VGICGKGVSAQTLRVRLEAYMDERAIPRKDATFYSHMLPSLESSAWRRNRVAGPGWLAVGDAGGLVDPITGEGLYYALRSGDLASRALLHDADPVQDYRAALSQEFARDLEFAAMLAKRVFLGKFFFRTVPEAMVHFMRRSHRFRDLMGDLFAGTQPYLDLRARLLRSLSPGLQERFMHFFLDNVIPPDSATPDSVTP